MKPNVGNVDRGIRYLLALALMITGILTGPGGTLSIVLYAAALVLVLTASIRFCPIYRLFGIRTCPAATSESRFPAGKFG